MIAPSAVLVVAAASFTGGVPLTIVGTSDLHGRIERLPVLAADVAAIRAELKKAGGAVIYVDGGDLFQGTLESNMVEGKSVIDGMNLIKPDAVAVGNHEFDYGPVGPLVIAHAPGDDPRGALKARAKDAQFPFLAANVIDEATGKPPSYMKGSVLVSAASTKVGIIGLTTMDTPHTTTASNFKGLKVIAQKDAVLGEVDALKKAGATVIVVVGHLGGACKDLSNPTDLSSCEKDSEVFNLANALPAGVVDVIVAGHTHNQIANVVNGIPIIESWANGRGFGRVDLDVDSKTHKATLVKVHAPQDLCKDDKAAACAPSDVDGAPITADAKVQAAEQPYLDTAGKEKMKKLGVVVKHEMKRGYDVESALGNMFADAMLEAAHDQGWKADVAVINGGGIRTNLKSGELTYGEVYEMMP
ncbi:MAG TPA: bifunctional UDP-sugar hydrolase/5'-nucleotidase, partial [Myxococcota bacterium]